MGDYNFKSVLSKYLRYWFLFVVFLIIGIIIAFLYIRYKTVPLYQASTTILLKDKDGGESSLETFGDLGLIKPVRNLSDEIGVLKSSTLMHDVLSELDMQVLYTVMGQVSEVEIYEKNIPFKLVLDTSAYFSTSQKLQIKLIDNTSYELSLLDEDGDILSSVNHEFGDRLVESYGTFVVVPTSKDNLENFKTPVNISFRDLKWLADSYSEQLVILPVNETGSLLEITLLDAIPQRGEDILGELLRVYGEQSLEYKNQLALNTIDLIDERLGLLTGELTTVEKDVEQYKQRNDLTNVDSDAALYLQQAAEAERQIADYQTQIDVLNSIEQYLNRSNDDSALVPSSLGISDQTLASLISKFNELQAQRNSLIRTTPKSNPLVVELDKQISDLRRNIGESLKNIRQGLVIAQNNLEQSSRRFNYQIRKVPSAERELVAINREQSTKQELYLFLLQKREEEALSLAVAVDNTRIIDEPESTSYPVSPNKTSIYLGAVILGLFIPFSIVYVKDSLDDSIQDVNDLRKLTKAPILGEIAHDKSKNSLISVEGNSGPVAEMFRLVRFNLKYLSGSESYRTLLVTSDVQGEGKTFFSINLAASLANTGNRVVILGFDLRAPQLYKDLKIKNLNGITDFLLSDTMQVKEIVKDGPVKNLDIITSGPVLPNTGELMLNDRVGILLSELKASYDYVIIDSPPIGKVADAFAITPHCDCTIFVVRQKYSKKSRIKELNNLILSERVNNPLLILNDTESKGRYGYGNYGSNS